MCLFRRSGSVWGLRSGLCFVGVHVPVSVVQHFVYRLSVGPFGRTDAQTDGPIFQMPAVVPVIQVILYSFDNSLGLGRRGIGQDGEKLVTAIADHGVGTAYGSTQQGGYFSQCEIARQVAEPSVDVLETIDINEQKGQWLLEPTSMADIAIGEIF